MTQTKDKSLDARDYLNEHVSKLRSEYSAIKENEALSEKNKDLLIKNLVDEAKVKAQTWEFQSMRKIKDEDMKAIKALVRQRVGDPKKITKEDIEEAVQFFYGTTIEEWPGLKNPYPRHKGFSDVRSMLTTDEEKQFFKENVQITKDGKINFIKMWRTFSLFSLDTVSNILDAWNIDYSYRDQLDTTWEKGKQYFTVSKILELVETSGKKIFRYQQQFEDMFAFLPGESYDIEKKCIYLTKLFGLSTQPQHYIYGNRTNNNTEFYRNHQANDAVLIGYIVNFPDCWWIVRTHMMSHEDREYGKLVYSVHGISGYDFCFYPNFLVYENNPV